MEPCKLLSYFLFLFLDTKEGRGEGGAKQVMIEVQPDTWKKTKRHPSKIKKENNDVRLLYQRFFFIGR